LTKLSNLFISIAKFHTELLWLSHLKKLCASWSKKKGQSLFLKLQKWKKAQKKKEELKKSEILQMLQTLPQAGGATPEGKAMAAAPAVPGMM